jgi:hypothetical protein
MAASARTVYAVVSRGADELFSSSLGRDAWARVGTITGSFGAALAVFGNAARFGPGTAGTGTYLWATADGVHWHRYPFSCPARESLRVGIAAASRSQVAFLCATAEGTFHTVKEVLRSVNGGRTEHLTGQAPVRGDFYGGFAVPPHRAKVLTIAVVTPGLSYLYRSANGGKTWAEIAIPGGARLNSLSYVSPTVGWAVVGAPLFPGLLHELLRTSDAGRTWYAVRF